MHFGFVRVAISEQRNFSGSLRGGVDCSIEGDALYLVYVSAVDDGGDVILDYNQQDVLNDCRHCYFQVKSMTYVSNVNV